MTTMMIRPVLPHLYKFDVNNTGMMIGAAMLIFMTVMITIFTACLAAEKFDGNKKNATLCFIGITFCVALALVCFFGCAAITVKGIILSLILALSSYEDIKKRECDDYLHLMIVIAAFIGTELTSLPGMLLSGLFAGGLMLITTLITKSNVGGADIKLAAACSFLLGLSRGIIGLLIGMILAVVCNAFKKDKKKGFPMIPYLAVGTMAAYFIQI